MGESLGEYRKRRVEADTQQDADSESGKNSESAEGIKRCNS